MISHKILWTGAVVLGVGILIALAVVEFAPEPYGNPKPTTQRSNTCSSIMNFGNGDDKTPCLPLLYLYYEGFMFGESAPLCLVLLQNSTIACKSTTTFEQQNKTYGLCLDSVIEVDTTKMYERYLTDGNFTFQMDFLFQYSVYNSTDPCYIENFYQKSPYPITYFPIISASTKNFSELNPSNESLFQVGVNSLYIFNLVSQQDTTVSEDLKYTAYLSTASPVYYGVTMQAPTYIQTIVQIFPHTKYTIIEYEEDFTWIDYVGMVLGVTGGVDVIIRCGEYLLSVLAKKKKGQGYIPVHHQFTGEGSVRSLQSLSDALYEE